MKTEIRHILLLIIVSFFAFFIHNNVIYTDIMESRNIVTAREMVEHNNWLVPTMNGELRMEKPPLPTWILGIIELFSPDNIILQRAASGIMATFLVIFFYLFSVKLTRKPLYGFMAALVLCTSFNIILMGRTASWDIYCHAFMMAAIYYIYKAFEGQGKCWKEFIWSGVFLGLSFLGKGPVSFYALLLPFLIAYFAAYRPYAPNITSAYALPINRTSIREKILPLICMLLMCAVISLWWPIYLYIFHKDMAIAVAQKESGAWLDRNVRPWYYYWQFFFEAGIWAFFLVTALIWLYWKKRIKLKREYIFTVVWTFAILILLSLLPEKKTRYLLPILIPASMVVAHLFFYYQEKVKTGALVSKEKWIFTVNGIIVALVGFIIPAALYKLFYKEGIISLFVFIALSVIFLSIAIALLKKAIKVKPLGFLCTVVILFFVFEAALMPYVAGLFNNPDRKSIYTIRENQEIYTLPFYYPNDEELRIELVYSAGRRILPVDIQNEEIILGQLPFILVSAKPAAEIIPKSLQNKVSIKLIEKYDDNRRLKSSGRYSDLFIRYVTLVEEKK